MCKSCNVLYINGIKCHEHGCPEAWKDHTKECLWCGQEFKPEFNGQKCCSDECADSYFN